jgi:hypothetical protein
LKPKLEANGAFRRYGYIVILLLSAGVLFGTNGLAMFFRNVEALAGGQPFHFMPLAMNAVLIGLMIYALVRVYPDSDRNTESTESSTFNYDPTDFIKPTVVPIDFLSIDEEQAEPKQKTTIDVHDGPYLDRQEMKAEIAEVEKNPSKTTPSQSLSFDEVNATINDMKIFHETNKEKITREREAALSQPSHPEAIAKRREAEIKVSPNSESYSLEGEAVEENLGKVSLGIESLRAKTQVKRAKENESDEQGAIIEGNINPFHQT